jgi:hypothetical protein
MAMMSRAGRSGFRISAGVGDFSLFSKMSRLAVGPTQPLVQWVFWFPGCKAPGV